MILVQNGMPSSSNWPQKESVESTTTTSETSLAFSEGVFVNINSESCMDRSPGGVRVSLLR